MGQKSNPNSFNKNNSIVFHNSLTNFTEYSKIFLIILSLGQPLRMLFEKKGCLIKNFHFAVDSKRKNLIIYISVFFSNLRRNKNLRNVTNFSRTAVTVKSKIFDILNTYKLGGYKKRFVFQNLNKTFSKVKLDTQFTRFRRELFYESSLSLTKILLASPNNAGLLAKFISKIFKLLHRTKKLNKFLFFLGVLVKFLVSNSHFIKGIKVQIKGRLRGASRSKVRLIQYGVISLQTIDSNICYSLVHTNTTYGTFGIRVWISSDN